MDGKWQAAFITISYFYALFGGFIFYMLEHKHEEKISYGLIRNLTMFLERNTCVSKIEMTNLLENILEAWNNGVVVLDNSTMLESKWNFVSSVFFSYSVMTTIGYGNISPSHSKSRLFLGVYATVGIPLLACTLAGISDMWSNIFESIFRKCNWAKERLGKKYYHMSRFAVQSTTTLTLFFVIPSVIISRVEGWTMAEGLYFSAVTLFTIGFGDYVAGNSSKLSKTMEGLYYHFLLIWLYFGLGSMVSVVSTISELFQKTTVKDQKPSGVSNKYYDKASSPRRQMNSQSSISSIS